ncbi:hypothetical protein SERLADRAFT_407970 [Serpula lacrymans var. lacrymans S7.9]|uniref:Uncharacterized protein n=1 Tax=Serpula lacrymans var. lacrymans (strain S7.9) TaxID=578457 RepID=F8NTK0_SERL9|nr:uncharacterized protein SERLADRAFT_407970 [Serpula lacrymans var. lacrymans S7.9]EGO25672.1 hypothetical protein SERLADRAFT_407970 [Serpula lacrymans var. lacrymans S7.9]
MSHFTTVTATYILVKYSRSYPSSAPSSQAQTSSDVDWQHFVNPVIKLYLDVKKSSTGELVSVRLRIAWFMDDRTEDVDRREVVFEDLELLSFSSLSPPNPQAAQIEQGLPLKAVYRDSVVGIRYLHPRVIGPGTHPVYRRFQITFLSPTAALQFIDAIRTVCPCKANPSTQTPVRNQTMHTDLSRPRTSTGLMSQTNTLIRTQTSHSAAPIPKRARLTYDGAFSRPSNPGRLNLETSTDLHVPSFTTSTPSRQMLPNNDNTSQISSSSVTLSSSSSREMINPDCDSSQPSYASRNDSDMMPPPPLPSSAPRPVEVTGPQVPDAFTSEFLASLRETPALYDLPQAELEDLVGHVIREEGFAKLLDALDSMWKVKGFLDR